MATVIEPILMIFIARGRRLFRLVNDKTDVFYDERDMRNLTIIKICIKLIL